METPSAQRRLRYVIIGAGMAGLLAAIKLQERGEADITIYEKGDSIGGTWRENRYAGLTCDVPAHAYTYSFAPNPDWSRFFASGAEIKRYFEAVAVRYNITRFIHFNTEIMSCTHTTAGWELTLNDGSHDRADVVIAATGVLHHPNIPALEGIEEFAGEAFHSARWKDGISFSGRRAGIIGGGSTGVQLLCALVEGADHVVHFNRSPQWIMPVKDFAYSAEERRMFRENPQLIEAIRNGEEYWNGVMRFNKAIIEPDSPEMAEIEAILLQNLEQSVTSPELREKLRPTYRAACKRLIYSERYYESIQNPKAILETDAIARIEPKGVRMKSGVLHELDVLVLATGFKADRFVRPMTVLGQNGADLNQVWAKRPTAYLAVSIPQFPNFFLLNGPTGPVGNFSLIDIAERQWGYIEQLLEPIRAGRFSQVAPRPETLADYEERRKVAARKTVFASGCTSWYLDDEGIPSTWPWSYSRFAEEMAHARLEEYDYA